MRKHYFGLYTKLFQPQKIFKGKNAICTYDGQLKMKVDLDDWIQQNVYFFGVYDPKSINFIKSKLQPGDYFFDIGANVGCFSLVASTCVGEKGKVFAFEPVKKVNTRLRENIELNQLNNISAISKAVFEKDSTLQLHIANQENLGMSSIQEHDSMSGDKVEVEAISLDSFISKNQINRVDFIKIDIEGAELPALKGMVNAIKKYKPTLLVEVSEAVLKNQSVRLETFQFFEKLDYEKFIINENGELFPPNQEDIKNYTNFIFEPAKHQF